jgi:hypothetical protein
MIAITAYTIGGIIFLLFRLWLDEIKLSKELDFRRRYLSRFSNYYFTLAMIFNFQVMAFNMILTTSLIALWVGFFNWDIKFYKRLYTGGLVSSIPIETTAQKVWMTIERLTLHIPILVFGTIPLFGGLAGIRSFTLGATPSVDLGGQVLSTLVAMIIYFATFFFNDERWIHHYKWPTAKIILIAMLASCVLVFPVIFVPTIIELA